MSTAPAHSTAGSPSASTAPAIGRLYLFALLGWAFDFYDLVLLGFIKEPVSEALHVSHGAQAWLLGVALGASGLGGIVGGALADRVGKRTMLAWTVFIYSLGSLVCGLAPNVWVFVAGRAIVGLGVGGEWAIGHGMLAEAVPPERRGRWAAALQSGEPLGVALAALVGYLVLPRVGWRAVLIGSSATALIALAARRSVHLPNTPSAHAGSVKILVRARLGGRLAAAWLLGVFKLGTYWTCYTWLPSFLREMHQPIARSLAWMLTAQIGQLLGMLTFGAVSDRLGRRPAFAICLGGGRERDRPAGVRLGGALDASSPVLGDDVPPRHRVGMHGGFRRAPRRALSHRGARRRDGHDVQPRARRAAPGARRRSGRRHARRPRGRPERAARARARHRVLGLGPPRDARHRPADPRERDHRKTGRREGIRVHEPDVNLSRRVNVEPDRQRAGHDPCSPSRLPASLWISLYALGNEEVEGVPSVD